MASHNDIDKAIDAQLQKANLSADELLTLTIARRLNNMSENGAAQVLSGVQRDEPKKSGWFNL